MRVSREDVDYFYQCLLFDGKEASMPCLASCLDLSRRVSFPLSVQLNTRGNFPRKVLSIFCSADGPLLSAEGWIPTDVFPTLPSQDPASVSTFPIFADLKSE